ncbi:MAG: DUF202 domain-containing protein [Pirellulaceae bacterium]
MHESETAQTVQPTLRDTLARDRTLLANERTLLAYARTAIMLGVSGVTLIKLYPESRFALIACGVLLPASILLSIFAVYRFGMMKRELSTLWKRDSSGS